MKNSAVASPGILGWGGGKGGLACQILYTPPHIHPPQKTLSPDMRANLVGGLGAGWEGAVGPFAHTPVATLLDSVVQ